MGRLMLDHTPSVQDRLAEACLAAGAHEPPSSASSLAYLDAILIAPDPVVGLETLLEHGALESLLPEVESIVDFHRTCAVHHKDLWAHTLEVMERTQPRADLRWAVLMHDVGKIDTRALNEAGRVTFHRHEERGAQMMRVVGQRLHMASARVDRIAFIIERHGWVNAYAPSWTDRAVRRLIRQSGVHLQDLLDFSASDYTTRRRARQRRIAATLEHLNARILRLAREDASRLKLPRGLGSALSVALDLPPGPQIGEAIEWLRGEIHAGRLDQGASVDVLVAAARESR